MRTFLRCVRAEIDDDDEAYLYRLYVTESAHAYAHGKALVSTWAEWLDKLHTPVDTRSAEEIAVEVVARLGLVAKPEDEELRE